MNSSYKSVVLSLFVAQSIVLSIIEALIPLNFFVPGVKLGLANIITIVALQYLSTRQTLVIVIARSLLTSFLAGNVIIFAFSLVGGILSTLAMAFFIKKCSKFVSIIGTSITGAFFHNIGQVFIAYIMIQDTSVFMFLPFIIIFGVLSGILTGYISHYLIRYTDGILELNLTNN